MPIHLDNSSLRFDFSAYHPDAKCGLSFQRTLRIPDDGEVYPLPMGLGAFTLRHVDDYASRLPNEWVRRGGVFFPMYQAEAMWISFESRTRYPIALKVASGKINCINGEAWDLELRQDRASQTQNYVVIPGQYWLDGFAVGRDTVRQFVAMPLGAGFTAEEQVSGHASWGGLQFAAIPLKREKFEQIRARLDRDFERSSRVVRRVAPPSMGLAPGGKMRQQIFQDLFDLTDWDVSAAERCFVSIINSEQWDSVTGEPLPEAPITAQHYARFDMPWFDYYVDKASVQGSDALSQMKGISEKALEVGNNLAENFSAPASASRIIKL